MAISVGTAVAYLDLNMTAFNQGLQQAQSALQTFQNSSSSLGQNLISAGGLATNIGSSLTRNITVPLVNAGQEVIEFGATFDKQMSAVEAVMKNRLKEGDFERLREAAVYWGNQTVYTATEAAEALYYMGLAGWDADQAISGLGNVLNLAAAGQMDLGRASDVVTDSMTAMRLEAGEFTNGIENTAYYTSVLAAVMANSNTDIDKLGESFKYVAPIAGDLEYTIEDLGTVLGLVANAGIKSSQAGTSVRQALKQLISPTEKTANAMEKYGISLFDATGNALPLIDVVLQLREKFGGLNLEVVDANGEFREGEEVMQEYANSLPISQQEKLAAIVDMFGTRAMPAMLSVIDEGETNFYELRDAIEEAAETGEYAATMAHTQLDNLAGDWVYFTSALGTAKILLSDIVNGELRQLVQWATEMVRKFNELDEAQKEQIIKWGLILAAVGPVLMLFGNLLRSVGFIVEAFKAFNPLIQTASTIIGQLHAEGSILSGILSLLKSGIGALFTPMTGWIALIALVIAAVVDLWKNNEEFRENVIKIWDAIKDAISRIWEAVKPIFETLIDLIMRVMKAIEPIIAALVDVLAPVIEAILDVLAALFEILSPIINMLLDFLIPVIEQVANWIKFLLDVLKPVFELIKVIFELISKVANFLGDVLGAVLRKAEDAWKGFWQDIADGLRETYENIVNWFSNLSPIKWLKEKWSDLKAFLKIDGSHANGLSYVPFDGYIAELHKGERVLTAKENQQYNGGVGMGGATINFYSNEKIDEYTAARELKRTIHDIQLGLV